MQKVFESSFEDGFYDFQGIGELTCPNGWTPSWLPSTGPSVLHRPEYDLKDTAMGHPEVRSGRFAANFFTVHATHDACLYRKFRVTEGRGLRVSVWCMNVSRDQQGTSGGHGMRIGIDPTGGTDHTAPTVIYGDYWSSYMENWHEREWRQVSTEAVTKNSEITIFMHAKCDFPVEINASHWDDLVIEVGNASEVAVPEQEPLDMNNLTPQKLEAFIREIVRDELNKA